MRRQCYLPDKSALAHWAKPTVAPVLDELSDRGLLAVYGAVEIEVIGTHAGQRDRGQAAGRAGHGRSEPDRKPRRAGRVWHRPVCETYYIPTPNSCSCHY